jgi:hypothetical protein
MAGRWASEDIFSMLSSFRDDSGDPFCNEGVVYPIAKAQLCNARDILAGLGGPTALCDAVSMAIYFEAEPIVLGGALPAAQPSPGCLPGVDPINDFCP